MTRHCLTICLLFAPSSVWGAPYDGRSLPADTTWVMHIDMEALHESASGTAMREKWLSHEKARKHIDQIREQTGMDPSQDILGATFFDSKFEKHHGVAMIHVRNADAQKLLARLNEKEPDNKMVEYGPYKLYVWSKERGHDSHKEHTVCGTLYDGQAMIFSRDALQVMRVLDVLDGKAAGLSADSPLGAAPDVGTVVLMRGEGISKSAHELRCPVLKDSSWFEVAIGASGGKSFANMYVDTSSDDVAKNAKAVIEGFRALVGLKAKGDDVQKLLSNLEVSASGTSLSARWSANELEAMKTMDNLGHRWRKKHSHWKQRHKD